MVVSPSWDDVVVGYRSTGKTVYSARHHMIWCPEHRRRLLAGRVEVRFEEIIFEAVTGAGGQVVEAEVRMPDHVHLLVEAPSAVVLSRVVQKLKGRSSRMLRAGLPAPRRLAGSWSASWFVPTVGGAASEVAWRYVENHEQPA